MASLIRDKNTGRRSLQFTIDVDAVRKRPRIYLGEVTHRAGRELKEKVEGLIAQKRLGITDPALSGWLATIDVRLYDQLAALGLAPERKPAPAPKADRVPITLGNLYAEFFKVLKVKKGTLDAYKQGADSLLQYFGDSAPLASIDGLAAEMWQKSIGENGRKRRSEIGAKSKY